MFARLAQVGPTHGPRWPTSPGGRWSARPRRSAITALRPTAGQDVAATRARLLDEHRILTTAGAVARAPHEMREPLLRISPHVDCTPEALAALGHALAG